MRYVLTVLLLILAVPVFADGPGNTVLTWTYTGTGQLGFHAERAPKACTPIPADADFTRIGEVGAAVRTYTDATTTTGGKYCYRVRAWNLKFATDPESAQYTPWSNLAGVEFPLAAPDGAPSGLTVR